MNEYGALIGWRTDQAGETMHVIGYWQWVIIGGRVIIYVYYDDMRCIVPLQQ